MSALELVDVVNEQNEIIETVSRAQMRKEHLPHRASYIAFLDRQGKFLVEVRTLCKDYSPGTFDPVIGGVMQHGEEEIESAKRELLEEINVDANSDKVEFYPLSTYKIQKGTHYLFAYLYLAKGDCITKRQQSEVSGILYLSLEDIYRLQDSCSHDSVVALTEIVKRAKEQDLL